jgi:predicted DNA-binding transcriptional regulator AlpA
LSSAPAIVPPAVAVAAELLRDRDAAALLSISVASLWRDTAAGRLPAPVKIGRKTRWRRSALLAWIERGCPAVPGKWATSGMA